MSARSSSLAPLLLRLSLGVTFLWAGMGKLFAEFPVSGEQAAYLANHHALEKVPARPGDPPVSEPKAPSGGASAAPAHGTTLVAFQGPQTFSAADFPDPVQTRRVNGIALMLRGAANPAPREDGSTPFPLWPKVAGEGRWPIVAAWCVAITELAGGGLLLVGLLTRLAALSVAGAMTGAIWLTEVGPAIQSGKTALGFLPVRETYAVALSPGGYVSLLWQVALLTSALAVALLGPGMLAMDSAMFGRAPSPKPAPPKPAS